MQREALIEMSDFSGSFLVGRLSKYKICLVRIPKGMMAPRGPNGKEQCFIILGNCYGLPEAPQILYRKIDTHMMTQGFRRSTADLATYIRGSWEDMLAVVTEINLHL